MIQLLMLALGFAIGRNSASQPGKQEPVSTAGAFDEITCVTICHALMVLAISWPMVLMRQYINMTDDGAEKAHWIFIPGYAAFALIIAVASFQQWWQRRCGVTPVSAVCLSVALAAIAGVFVWLYAPMPDYITCDYQVVGWKTIRQCTQLGHPMWVWLVWDLAPAAVYAVSTAIAHAIMLRFNGKKGNKKCLTTP
jgi:hypothetical protein